MSLGPTHSHLKSSPTDWGSHWKARREEEPAFLCLCKSSLGSLRPFPWSQDVLHNLLRARQGCDLWPFPLVIQARLLASLKKSLLKALVFWGRSEEEGMWSYSCSHSPHPSLQAINSRLIVFKAVTLWLTNNNDNEDGNEVEPSHGLDIVPSGQMGKLRTLCPGTWAMQIWPLCSRRFSSVGKRLLGRGSQDNELGGCKAWQNQYSIVK